MTEGPDGCELGTPMRLSRFFSALLSRPSFSVRLVLSWFVRLEAAMRYETMTLGSNVIRFPVELRAKPSIDLLIEVAPDSREVDLIAEARVRTALPGWAEQGGSRDGGDDREEGFAGRSEGAAGGVERDAEATRRSRGRRLRRSAPGGAAFGRGGREACERADRGRLLAGSARGRRQSLGGRVRAAPAHRL